MVSPMWLKRVIKKQQVSMREDKVSGASEPLMDLASQCLGLPSSLLCVLSFFYSFLIEKVHFLIPFNCFIGHCSLGMEAISAILFPFHSTM